MLKQKDPVIYILPATDSTPARVAEGTVVDTMGEEATCLVAFTDMPPRDITVNQKSGRETSGNGFVVKKSDVLMPLAVNEKIAAKMIGFSVPFLANSRHTGVLKNHTPAPPYVKRGRAVRYLVNDLLSWLADGRREMKHPENDFC